MELTYYYGALSCSLTRGLPSPVAADRFVWKPLPPIFRHLMFQFVAVQSEVAKDRRIVAVRQGSLVIGGALVENSLGTMTSGYPSPKEGFRNKWHKAGPKSGYAALTRPRDVPLIFEP